MTSANVKANIYKARNKKYPQNFKYNVKEGLFFII